MASLDLALTLPKQKIEFVLKEDRFFCPVCECVLRRPMQLPCGHCVCDGCINTLFDSDGHGYCPMNPDSCNETFAESEIHQDYGLRRDILSATVYCPEMENGCAYTSKLKQIERHLLSDCEWRLVNCTFKDKGCDGSIRYKDLQDHISTSCVQAPVVCAFCKLSVSRGQIKEHHGNICTEISLSCPYGCGIQSLKRSKMTQHMKECCNRLLPCQYQIFGCAFKGKTAEHKDHEEIFPHKHLEMSVIVVKNLLQEKEKTRIEMKGIAKENQCLRHTVNILTEEVKQVKTFLGIPKNFADIALRQSRSLPTALSTLVEKQQSSIPTCMFVPRTKPPKPRSRHNSSSS
ncbi:TNF receptor-associated factor 3-like [Mytilus californianus]|uniref:TNF receptor-associated factor 3-like n=1 Tax=Mytilus californianus TaxID=6549 RepID=UPI0022465254|nr:TNF receptor-associated factor 3-like [Mytilus californianus]